MEKVVWATSYRKKILDYYFQNDYLQNSGVRKIPRKKRFDFERMGEANPFWADPGLPRRGCKKPVIRATANVLCIIEGK